MPNSPREISEASHFNFGENWRSYASLITEDHICKAVNSLNLLVGKEEIWGKTFLDIGCGSGLSMLAAIRSGAASVYGIDIDRDSVATARELLSRFAGDTPWKVQHVSIFNLPADQRFDIVHSWGVLHHTGDMWKAISKSASLVGSTGRFVFALYHETPLCGFWRIEKRFYMRAPSWLQFIIRFLYKSAFKVGLALTGRWPADYIASYKNRRGMDWHHDVHDWLGGYPYESTLPRVVAHRLQNFEIEKVLQVRARGKGIFGTGCDEYVARRKS